MKRKHFLALTLASFVTACTSSNPNPKAPSKVTLTISVAASLQDVMKAVKNIYQLENPNLEIIYNFGDLFNKVGFSLTCFLCAARLSRNT